jgi:hypothetical protein
MNFRPVQHPHPNRLTHGTDRTSLNLFPQVQVDRSESSGFGVGGYGGDYNYTKEETGLDIEPD